MKQKFKQRLLGMVGLLALLGTTLLLVLATRSMWRALSQADPDLAVGVLTAATTLIVATFTVVLGKYHERKRAIEAHFRDKKTEIYDEFLRTFFEIFHKDQTHEVAAPAASESNPDVVEFLREWQRKVIVWGGSEVLLAYMAWLARLKRGHPDAKGIFLMEKFFLAMRKDLGLSNKGLRKGVFAALILRNADLFLEVAAANPDVTLDEIAAREKELGLQ